MAKATAATIDFTNVKDGGNFNKKHQPPGDYKAKITAVQDAVKKDDKAVKMWLFTIQVGTGTYPYYCNRMAENQLWKIRNLFVAAGVNVPKKRVAVDPNKLVGKAIAVTLDDEEYDGKMQSQVQSTFPISELEDATEGADEDDEDETEEEPEEETPAPTPKKSKKDKGKKSKQVSQEEPTEGKKKKAKEAPQEGKKKKARKVEDVADEELEELDIEDI